MLILLNSVEKVKEFINLVSRFEDDIDLISGRYLINAKSIMGILSLDLSRPIILKTYDGPEEAAILKALEKYEYPEE